MKKKQYKKLLTKIGVLNLRLSDLQDKSRELEQLYISNHQYTENMMQILRSELQNKNKSELLEQAKQESSKEIIQLLENDIKEKYPEKLNRLQVTAIEDKAYLESLIKIIKMQQKVKHTP